MSKITASIIPAFLVILLTVLFFLSPRFFSTRTTDSGKVVKEIIVNRFLSIGNVIAHASFVEDAIIMDENAKLNEIITNLRRDESEITSIYFTDKENKIIASIDPDVVGKVYESATVESEASVVTEKDGIYTGGFSITIGKKHVGALYFAAKPIVSTIKVTDASNPIVLIPGIVIALIVFFITFSTYQNIGKKVVADINKQQEAAFSPKLGALKKEQINLEKAIEENKSKYQILNDEYEAKKKEIESNPTFQSVEKLKAAEQELLKRLETLKEQKEKLDKEVELLAQKREEIRSALQAEKKEESILHEKLTLIKKKILRLETPEK